MKQHIELFDVAVSNPPYQQTVGGKRHQVYPEFFFQGFFISENMSMVFPFGWQKSTGRASGSVLHPHMRSLRELVSVDNYLENAASSPVMLFPTVLTRGVSIVHTSKSHDNQGSAAFFEHGDFVEYRDMTNVQYWSARTDIIFQNIAAWMQAQGITSNVSKVSSWNPFGVTAFMTDDPSRAEFHKFLTETPEDITGYVKVWSRNVQNQYAWHYVSQSEPFLKLESIDQYKVIWPITGQYGAYRKTKLLAPQEIASDTFIMMTFDSEHHAQNFQTYYRTFFYRFVSTEATTSHHGTKKVHQFAPDLSTVTNPRTGLVGYDTDWTDDDLKILFQDILTAADWEYIQQVAIASD